MNNKGFTLIELMAAIILLAVIMSVTTVSVVNVIQNSKKKSYDLLVDNIKIGAQEFYDECDNIDIIGKSFLEDVCNNLIIDSCITDNTIINGKECSKNKINEATIALGNLAQYGFLKTNSTDDDKNKIIENPKTNDNMNNCRLKIFKYVDKTNYTTWYEIYSASTESYCPTNLEYVN